jgi:hypothetical protein
MGNNNDEDSYSQSYDTVPYLHHAQWYCGGGMYPLGCGVY